MSKARPTHFKSKLIALSVVACFGLPATHSAANPIGGTVSSGSATFASSGNTLTITNTANTIINWQSFSIGVNDITRFLQSSGSSAVLNRVVGTNGVIPQSVIDGILSSNGRVFLLNASGIVIGANARIDVAGFVASSLNLSDQDFKSGRMRFTETPGAGGVSNAGVIDTSSGGPGGRVFLVGPDVQNSGIIRTPQGEIVLAAGKSVELVSENSPFVTVNITADSERALNLGQLIADSGHIGMFGALVRQGGVAEANSAVAGASGEIRLVATKDLTLDEGSRTTANGPSGGNVILQAQGGTNLIYGTVEAKGSSGQGGTIEALGVRVGVLGYGLIDASGETGGGAVLVGGDYHGANPDIQNAQQTVIGSDGIIRADAGTTGDGGRVIVWSDQSTKFFGTITARGGTQSGNGGFVETSGNALQAFGSVDTSAPNGKGGTWLLDPDNIQIVATGNAVLGCATILPAICFDDAPGTTSQIAPGTIDAGLRTNGIVTLQAHKDIDVLTPLNLTIPGNFIAQAGNNINLGANGITSSAATNITLTANDVASATPSGTGSITSTAGGGNISTTGGSVNLSGAGITVGTITTGGGVPAAGSVAMTATGDISSGAISTQSAGSGGSVVLSSTSGKVTVSGNISTAGAAGTAGGIVNGSNGGGVSISGAAGVGINGSIVTSGGDGATPVNGGQGGFGGSAGGVFIAGGGDAVVQGGIAARGGNGAAGTLGGFGGNGGLGGVVVVSGGGNVSVVSGAIDVSGGSGGAGSAAAVGTLPIPGGNGGAGGGAGLVELVGQNVTANGPVLAAGGAGGAGGDGITASPTGGAGGAGGSGGLVIASAPGVVTTGTITADGGGGGNGGAYGGAGGKGGDAFVFSSPASAPTSQLLPSFTLVNPPAGVARGGVIIDAPTLVLNQGGVISAKGGNGGNGGAVGPVGGNGGNGGNGGVLVLAINGTPAAGTLSVIGGAGGIGGASTTPGIDGLAGLDGSILIGRGIPDTLAANTILASVNQVGNFAAPLGSVEQKLKKDDDAKKGALACK